MSQYGKNEQSVKRELTEEILRQFYVEGERCDFFNFAEIQIAGRPTYPHYGNRHIGLSETDALKIYDCVKSENGSRLDYKLMLRNDIIDVTVNYSSDKKIGVNKIYTTVKNVSGGKIGLDYVSSYVDVGFWKNGFGDCNAYVSSNGWYTEAQWSKIPLTALGVFNGNKSHSMKNYVFGNTGTWPTKSRLPILILENAAKNEFVLYNAESNNCWNIELGDLEERISVNVDGGNREDNGGYTRELPPDGSYSTICTVMIRADSLEGLFKKLTDYRRSILTRNHDVHSALIFNEYMWFCEPLPTQDNLMQYIDALERNGITPEYFVIDCGWHDEDGDPFYSIGKWEESKLRFPDGLARLLDKVKARGIKTGLWIEPELVGADGDAKNLYADDCYFQRGGHPTVISRRYHLDFRNEKVTDRLTAVIDRMIRDYGLGYIKIDYNVEARTGTEFGTDNSVAAMQEHAEKVLEWLGKIGERYPALIIETCASGGNRMDNQTVALSDLISTSDQVMVKKYAYIAGNIFTALLPEQAGIWCYPAGKNGEPITDETVIMNMVNASLCVMQMASKIDELTPFQINLVKEGVNFYKSVAKFKSGAYPYYPNGLNGWDSDSVVFGLKKDNKCYLAVYGMKGTPVKVDFGRAEKDAKVGIAYPKAVKTAYSFKNGVLTLNALGEPAARIFEIDFRS